MAGELAHDLGGLGFCHDTRGFLGGKGLKACVYDMNNLWSIVATVTWPMPEVAVSLNTLNN